MKPNSPGWEHEQKLEKIDPTDIKLDGISIRSSAEVTLLGVVIERELNVANHTQVAAFISFANSEQVVDR